MPSVIIDTNYLCWRAYYTTGGLSYKEIQTGVVYGVLREVLSLCERYQPDTIAFAFDSKTSKRKKLHPPYKANREYNEAVVKEITTLRKEYLPELGFQNVFVQKGYEADDIVAAIAENLHFADTGVIVSGDKDLYQCLRTGVKIYNPTARKEYTLEDFITQWNLHPCDWARCKAIAGCPSDNIKGIEKVGEITAAKWIRGELKQSSTAANRILDGLGIVSRNLELVRLPFEGIKSFELKPHTIKRKRWRALLKRLGMRSLISDLPIIGV